MENGLFLEYISTLLTYDFSYFYALFLSRPLFFSSRLSQQYKEIDVIGIMMCKYVFILAKHLYNLEKVVDPYDFFLFFLECCH